MTRTMGFLISVLCVCVLAGCESEPSASAPEASAAHVAPPVPAAVEPFELGTTPNVHRVGNILTAAQVPAEALEPARDAGYRVVLDLRSQAEDRGYDERAAVEALGMTYINPGFRGPDELTDEVFDRSREVLRDSERKPVVMHCASANRVGGVWLAYRVLDQGVAFDRALEEARTIGLRTEALADKAKDYIERRRAEEQ